MEPITVWALIVGSVFLVAAFGEGPLKALPLSLSAIYLAIGALIGPWGFDLVQVDLFKNAETIATVTEIGVLLSLLGAGLRLSPSLTQLKRAAIPLASIAMLMTIAMMAALGYWALGLSIGAAVLLGAVLAPTDPVLAGDVQVKHHDDRDRLRYSLTGEAGLNDGTAFPFVMLGIGLLGLHELGDFGWRWAVVDLLWATIAGVACGWGVGYIISRLAVVVRVKSSAPTASEELLVLGMIGISYGLALAIHAYGFLAVFAAGVAMRKFAEDGEDDDEADTLMKMVTGVNERFGQIFEVGLVVLIGVLLTTHWTMAVDWWIAILLFFVIRPVAVYASLVRSPVKPLQKGLIAFFGIRGIGSLYYLTYAIGEGLDPELAIRLGGIVLTTIALSLLIHSNAATPLLSYYQRAPKASSQ